MMKRLLLAISVVALAAGGAWAQTEQPSGQMPAPPAPSMPAPSGGPGAGTGTMGQAPATGTASRPVHRRARVHASSRVREAQRALQRRGLYEGKIDGLNGPQTRAAVAAFQKQNGLKETARLDRVTMNKLMHGGSSQ
jgi:hypothetical protein